MRVNGVATAWLWEWALMLRASHAMGGFVGAEGGLCTWVFAFCFLLGRASHTGFPHPQIRN